MRGLIIAGTGSDAGKTTVTLGLMEALRREGVSVQAFKAGPDYIDPGHHALLLRRPSYNLDTWMMGEGGVKKTYGAHTKGSGIAIIEGVMGLFDGMGGPGGEGSTAHLAKVLGLPVLLVVDGSRVGASVAAMVKGFRDFDRGVDIRWVVFNSVAGPGHFRILKEAVEAHLPGVRVLGYMPRDEALKIKSRHLGLVTGAEVERRRWRRGIKRAARHIEAFVDMRPLLGRGGGRPRGAAKHQKQRPRKHGTGGPVIAVARDRAFSFYYEENLELLEKSGARLRFFSPLKDRKLPRGTRGIYIGGGYPEVYAGELSGNAPMLKAVREAAEEGRPIFAECGGLMYLARTLRDAEGRTFPMAGVFRQGVRMGPRLRALGYRDVVIKDGCPFLRKGAHIRGHEFRYSEVTGMAGKAVDVFRAVRPATGEAADTGGYLYKNTLATYIHLHFASNPDFARGFVNTCKTL